MNINDKMNLFSLLSSNHLLSKPYFFNESIKMNDVPLFNDLRNNFDIIKKEILDNFNDFNIDSFFHGKNYVFSKEDNLPSVLIGYSFFISYDIEQKIKNNNLSKEEQEKYDFIINVKNKCPITYSLIEDLKSKEIMTRCFVSKVRKKTYIIPHNDSLPIPCLRIHFCLVNDPLCTITVGNETRQWKENDFLIFNPSGKFNHGVNHDGEKDRIILAFDLKRSYLEQYFK